MRMVVSRVRDKKALKLIGKYLRAGVLGGDGKMEKSNGKGTPQGGPMTPRTQKIISSFRLF